MAMAGLAALSFYLASPHQTLWPAAPAGSRWLRWLSLPLAGGAVAAAAQAYGAWCGVWIACSGLMTGLVLLPYLDAWLRGRKQAAAGGRHVG
ncbi:hypothetical protein GJA_676 [Janthinobacterium agaricidamnosum NBRC 102515 = DSM 9628]|uniref:Transmembrane protein n=2 Tax=Janthinobacterium agaricidamnosum TaxID=55508 RepID=W0V137_9BURK|nr:hypothetical protein GJA_676 [Janthinobacterium agaricidamnosum NBRC 102515 = DSM 9628]